MTLDEAILHAREVTERNRKQYKNCPSDRRDIRHQTCEECAEEHEQLAEWLEDYKRLKNIPEHTYDNCHNLTCRRKCEKDGYNKAIDDFARIFILDNLDIYSLPVTERKNKFLELLSRTNGDTQDSLRREVILKEMRNNSI